MRTPISTRTESQETSLVEPSPRKTPRISSAIAAQARTISGSAGERSGGATRGISRSSIVFPGLGPGTHERLLVDGRAKPGQDGCGNARRNNRRLLRLVDLLHQVIH